MAMMFLSRKRNKKSRFKLFSGNPTSASWGTLIPTNVTRVVAGDDFSFQPGVGVQALPIVAPFMGNVCVKKEYFFIPDRIYNIDRQLNFQGVTDTPNTVYKPSIAPPIPFDISLPSGDKINISVSDVQTDLPRGSLSRIVGPGSLADYMGEAPGSIVVGVIDLTPYIGYIDIYYNYYLNQQYDLIPTSLAGTVSDSAMEYPYFLSVSELENYLRTIKTTQNIGARRGRNINPLEESCKALKRKFVDTGSGGLNEFAISRSIHDGGEIATIITRDNPVIKVITEATVRLRDSRHELTPGGFVADVIEVLCLEPGNRKSIISIGHSCRANILNLAKDRGSLQALHRNIIECRSILLAQGNLSRSRIDVRRIVNPRNDRRNLHEITIIVKMIVTTTKTSAARKLARESTKRRGIVLEARRLVERINVHVEGITTKESRASIILTELDIELRLVEIRVTTTTGEGKVHVTLHTRCESDITHRHRIARSRNINSCIGER